MREPFDLIIIAFDMVLTGLIYWKHPDPLIWLMMNVCFFVGTTVFFMVGIRELLAEYINYREEE